MEPTLQKDKELIKKILHGFTKMIKNVEDKSYEDTLRYLGLRTLEERRK